MAHTFINVFIQPDFRWSFCSIYGNLDTNLFQVVAHQVPWPGPVAWWVAWCAAWPMPSMPSAALGWSFVRRREEPCRTARRCPWPWPRRHMAVKQWINGWLWERTYRKVPYLMIFMGKSMVSCKSSHHPTLWINMNKHNCRCATLQNMVLTCFYH